jgi:hypothetical protein
MPPPYKTFEFSESFTNPLRQRIRNATRELDAASKPPVRIAIVRRLLDERRRIVAFNTERARIYDRYEQGNDPIKCGLAPTFVGPHRIEGFYHYNLNELTGFFYDQPNYFTLYGVLILHNSDERPPPFGDFLGDLVKKANVI